MMSRGAHVLPHCLSRDVAGRESCPSAGAAAVNWLSGGSSRAAPARVRLLAVSLGSQLFAGKFTARTWVRALALAIRVQCFRID